PTFTSTATGLKLSDTLASVVPDLAVTTAATAASNVGGYAITPGGTAGNANYAITFTPGTLTVTKAPLHIVPNLVTRTYGDADPEFTLHATGLRNDDTVDVVTNESFNGASATVAVGTYPNAILGATATNYSLTFGTGTINVVPRSLTIIANDVSREYGEANPTFGATFDGLASFDSTSVISGL